jgi:uncharacterized protein YjbI with pentapeptide repeats
MATASPVSTEPSQIHLTMPTIPIHSKSRLLDILTLLVGLLIALILAGILIALIFVPHTSNGIDLRESNENIARLQREQEIYIENQRQKNQEKLIEQQLLTEMQRLERQENLTEIHRKEDQVMEQQRRELELHLALEQSKQQLEIEERRLKLLLEERLLAEEHRKEDLNRENADLLSEFMDEIMSEEHEPLNTLIFQLKVHSLIRRFDPIHKSLLISYLYKAKLLNVENSDSLPLDLQGANLKDLDLDGIDLESGQGNFYLLFKNLFSYLLFFPVVDLWLNYTQLALPMTNLINASFEHIYLDKANFSMSNMMGASLRSSKVTQANFYRSILSFSDFRYANVFQSNFSYAKIQRASFQNADLTQAHMDNADLSSTNFQYVNAIETNFSRSEISNANFQYADLTQAQMNDVSIRSANFYNAKAIQTDFTHAAMPGCSFLWADLRYASFKNAFLAGTSFENADVENVDFTRAFLAGVNITAGQLNVALSITQAILPDGSIGKNKNLIKNGHAECTGTNGTVLDWMIYGDVFTNQDQSNMECSFQAREINSTLQQIIDIRRYRPLIQDGHGKVYIAMQDKTTAILNPSVYMIIDFFDSNNIMIDRRKL